MQRYLVQLFTNDRDKIDEEVCKVMNLVKFEHIQEVANRMVFYNGVSFSQLVNETLQE